MLTAGYRLGVPRCLRLLRHECLLRHTRSRPSVRNEKNRSRPGYARAVVRASRSRHAHIGILSLLDLLLSYEIVEALQVSADLPQGQDLIGVPEWSLPVRKAQESQLTPQSLATVVNSLPTPCTSSRVLFRTFEWVNSSSKP